MLNPPTPPELERVRPQTEASKPASNLSEPTCKAATRVEVSPDKPTTSPKPKPAASIEQSSNGAIESNLQIET